MDKKVSFVDINSQLYFFGAKVTVKVQLKHYGLFKRLFIWNGWGLGTGILI